MNDVGDRIARMRAAYPDASDETIQNYLALRDEGHTRYVAAVMSGLRDPDDAEVDA